MADLNINGQDVKIPAINTLDMDEAEIVYDYSGLTLDQIDEETGLRPGLLKALLHIAVRRATPGIPAEDIKAAVGKVKVADYVDAAVAALPKEDDDEVPPTSPGSSSENETSSGSASETTSGHPENTPPGSSGAPRSATSGSRLTRLAG